MKVEEMLQKYQDADTFEKGKRINRAVLSRRAQHKCHKDFRKQQVKAS